MTGVMVIYLVIACVGIVALRWCVHHHKRTGASEVSAVQRRVEAAVLTVCGFGVGGFFPSAVGAPRLWALAIAVVVALVAGLAMHTNQQAS